MKKLLLLLLILTGCATTKVFTPVEPVRYIQAIPIYNSKDMIGVCIDASGVMFFSFDKFKDYMKPDTIYNFIDGQGIPFNSRDKNERYK